MKKFFMILLVLLVSALSFADTLHVFVPMEDGVICKELIFKDVHFEEYRMNIENSFVIHGTANGNALSVNKNGKTYWFSSAIQWWIEPKDTNKN